MAAAPYLPPLPRPVRPTCGLALCWILSTGCAEKTATADGNSAGKPESLQAQDAAAPSDAAAGATPAVLLAAQVVSPEGFNTYIKLFPDVPEGKIGVEDFHEFGNANAYAFGGYVFVEEDGTFSRFSVDHDLKLVDELRFSWQNFGVPEINESYTVFVSLDRAYTFAPAVGDVMVWSPRQMQVTGTIPMNLPKRPAGMTTFAYDGRVVGDKVIWNLLSANWDTLKSYPAVTLAVADANSDTPIQYVEDDRCLPGGPSLVANNGDYYVHGGAYFGLFLAYAAAANSRTCLLRVNAGSAQFDADYLLDYKAVTGSYFTHPWVHVADGKWIARVVDPNVPIPEDSEDYWSLPDVPKLVDVEAQTALPYPDIERGQSISGMQFVVDGISYYEVSETGYVAGGNTDVVELHADGTQMKFHLAGFLLGLERVR